MELVIFKDLPMPPSINDSYMSIRQGNRSTIIATKHLRKFKAEMLFYKAKNFELIKKNKQKIQEFIKQGFCLNFDLFVFFTEDKIFTKTKKAKSKYKRLDADNRVKAMRDAISELLEVDDTYFFSGNTEKCIGDDTCLVKIRPTKIQKKQEILKSLECSA